MAAPKPLPPAAPRPTRRLAVQSSLGVLLYLAGANVSAGWVVVVAALVLTGVPVGWWQCRRAARSVVVRVNPDGPPSPVSAGSPREHVVRASFVGDAVAVVTDETSGAVLAVRGDDGPRSGRVRGRRGAWDRTRVRVEVGDRFGLWRATTDGVVEHAPIVVWPGTAPAGRDEASPLADHGDGDDGRPGHGVEPLHVREFRHGDQTRAVHWRSTLRRGELMVREHAIPPRRTTVLVVRPGLWEQADLDAATAALCRRARLDAAEGGEVVVAADGRAVGWGPAARTLLAGLPPHAGTAARPLVETSDRVLAAAVGHRDDVDVQSFGAGSEADRGRPTPDASAPARSMLDGQASP